MNELLMALLGLGGGGLGNYTGWGAPSGGYGGWGGGVPSAGGYGGPGYIGPPVGGGGGRGYGVGEPPTPVGLGYYGGGPTGPPVGGGSLGGYTYGGGGGGPQQGGFNQGQRNYIQSQGKLPTGLGGGALNQAQQNFFNTQGYLPKGFSSDLGQQYYRKPPLQQQPAAWVGYGAPSGGYGGWGGGAPYDDSNLLGRGSATYGQGPRAAGNNKA
jgi:hypothetical protein